MLVSTQQSSSSLSLSSCDSQADKSTTVAPQNLPPRLQQTSPTENESNFQVSTTSQSGSSSSIVTNGRRHRSVLQRGNGIYHSSHLPPPLMSTPPGILYTYPPVIHQPAHIAYNIHSTDELELLACQQQMMNQPTTPLLWLLPSMVSHHHPQFSSSSLSELPTEYLLNSAASFQLTNSFLNPKADEWIPLANDNSSSSLSDNNVYEINFPPLNSTTNNTQTSSNVTNNIEDNSENVDSLSEITSTNNGANHRSPVLTNDTNSSS